MNRQVQLSDAEWEIMKVLWSSPGLSASEVAERLAHTGWHPKTVRTMLDRLQRKGALRVEAVDRLYRYTPELSRESCIEAASTNFLSRVFDGAFTPMVAHFVSKAPLSKKDRAELERILDKYRNREDE